VADICEHGNDHFGSKICNRQCVNQLIIMRFYGVHELNNCTGHHVSPSACLDFRTAGRILITFGIRDPYKKICGHFDYNGDRHHVTLLSHAGNRNAPMRIEPFRFRLLKLKSF
jgi:hypothetical protein